MICTPAVQPGHCVVLTLRLVRAQSRALSFRLRVLAARPGILQVIGRCAGLAWLTATSLVPGVTCWLLGRGQQGAGRFVGECFQVFRA